MRASIVLLLISTATCLAVHGAEVHTMTLRDAIDLALEKNPDVLLSRLDEQKSRDQVTITREPFSLRAGVGSGAAYTYGVPASINGNAPSIFRGQANMDIFNRPQSYLVAQASEAMRGASIDTRLRQEEVVYRVYTAFLDAELAVRSVEATREGAKNLASVKQYHDARVAEGREKDITSRQANLEILKAQQSIQRLTAAQTATEVALAQVLGLPPGDQVRPAREDRGQIELPDSEEASTTKILESSPEIRRLESNIQAKTLEMKSYKAQRIPKVSMVADYSLLAKFNNFLDFYSRFQRNNFQIGASIEVPLFVGKAAGAYASQAQADMDKLRVEINRTRGRITADVKQAYSDVQIAEGARALAREDLDLAHDQIKLDMAEYEEGRAPFAQLEASRAIEQQKYVAYYGAQKDVETARLNVLKTTGTLLASVR